MRVVIAEDLALLRDGLTRLLEAYDFEVVAAVDDAVKLGEALRDASARHRGGRRADAADVHRRGPAGGDRGAGRASGHARPGAVAVRRAALRARAAEQRRRRGRLPAEGSGRRRRRRSSTRCAPSPAGGTVLDPEVVASLIARAPSDSPVSRLTDREREVLALMAQGRSNTAIASALFVTEKAISKHTSNIFMKLDLDPDDDSSNRRVKAVIAFLQS